MQVNVIYFNIEKKKFFNIWQWCFWWIPCLAGTLNHPAVLSDIPQQKERSTHWGRNCHHFYQTRNNGIRNNFSGQKLTCIQLCSRCKDYIYTFFGFSFYLFHWGLLWIQDHLDQYSCLLAWLTSYFCRCSPYVIDIMVLSIPITPVPHKCSGAVVHDAFIVIIFPVTNLFGTNKQYEDDTLLFSLPSNDTWRTELDSGEVCYSIQSEWIMKTYSVIFSYTSIYMSLSDLLCSW